MGELVGLLEQRGYVERRPDPADRRARLVCFTARGRQLFEAGNAHLRAIEADWQRRWRNVGLPPGMTAKLAQALEAAEHELAQQ